VALKLFLIRHAEPVLTGVFLGCKNDSPLKHPPADLDLPVEIAYVSPLTRALQTSAGLASPKIVVPDLREIDFGEWGGLNWDEIEHRWPDMAARGHRDWFGMTPPGGEPWEEFSHRVRTALGEILKDPRPKAIVAHGAVNAVIGGELGAIDPRKFKQTYGQVTEFEL
jgi:broad specificity phosphatase PhoE